MNIIASITFELLQEYKRDLMPQPYFWDTEGALQIF